MRERMECGVCHERVSESGAQIHVGLLVYIHGGECKARVDALERDYSTSKRGKWRSYAEMWRMLGLDDG